jgi:4'-phosphopantetheinyl transferase
VVVPPTRAVDAPASVETWLVSLAPRPGREPSWWWELLDGDEVARAAAWRRPADRARYVGRHVALRLILAEHLGVAPATLVFDRAPCPLCGGAHGRPVVRDRDDVHFSLSSTGDVAAVAVAPVPVGLDVEAVGRASADDLAAALDPVEQAAVAALGEPARSRAALRCWARKEALLKGRGTGLGIDPDAVHVGVGPPARAPRPDGWVLADVPVPPDLVAAVAYRSAGVLAVEMRALRLPSGDDPAADSLHEALRRTRTASH